MRSGARNADPFINDVDHAHLAAVANVRRLTTISGAITAGSRQRQKRKTKGSASSITPITMVSTNESVKYG